jgi:ataxin-10
LLHGFWLRTPQLTRELALSELSRLLDRLLPRTLWGKTRPSPHQQTTEGSVDESGMFKGENETSGFAYVKRELVKLVGLMAHSDRLVQDRLRVCGGIEVVLNMCIVDERNPCERRRLIRKCYMLMHDFASHARACVICTEAHIGQ